MTNWEKILKDMIKDSNSRIAFVCKYYDLNCKECPLDGKCSDYIPETEEWFDKEAD